MSDRHRCITSSLLSWHFHLTAQKVRDTAEVFMWAVDPHILLYRSSRSISVFFFNIGCFSHKLWQHGGTKMRRNKEWNWAFSWTSGGELTETWTERNDSWLRATPSKESDLHFTRWRVTEGFFGERGNEGGGKRDADKRKRKKKHFQPALPPHHHSLGGTRDYGNV